jgi:thiamine pyrophosphate-dependent acetolactate synthase large subunit-like protein
MLEVTRVAEGGRYPKNAFLFTGTGGQLMVEQLKAAAVDYIFTNPGSFEVGFFDACLDEPMQVILCLHEGIVVSAADGYARVSGKPGFMNVHAFASAQAAGQLYNAHYDNTSLIITSGMREIGSTSSPTHRFVWPDWDIQDAPSRFAKMTWLSRSAKDLPVQIRRAFRVATVEPGGPVYLAVTEAAQKEEGVSAWIHRGEDFISNNNIAPSQRQLDASSEALLNAKTPVIWLGDQITKDKSYEEVIELAELLSIPVCDSWVYGNFANFPHRHPLYAGFYNDNGRDLILAFGMSRYDEPRLKMSKATTIICCSTYGYSLSRPNYGDISITANTQLALRGLIDTIESMATKYRIRQTADSRNGKEPDFGNEAALAYEPPSGYGSIHPDQLGASLELELDKNCIIVDENLQGSRQFFSYGPRENEKMLVQNGGGCLGWGIGAAIGAKIADPNRQVVLSIGDGAVMYSAAGFWTMARYEIPVLMIVSNNHNYETVRQLFGYYSGKMRAADRFIGTMLDRPLVDFVGLAKSEGCDGIRVENVSDLRPAIRRGIEATREGIPFLVDVDVARIGIGADSTWFQEFSVAQLREKKV